MAALWGLSVAPLYVGMGMGAADAHLGLSAWLHRMGMSAGRGDRLCVGLVGCNRWVFNRTTQAS